MRLRLSTGIVTGLLLLLSAPTADAGSCAPRPGYSHRCPVAEPARTVDLRSVPDISKDIVLDEPAAAAKRRQPAAAAKRRQPDAAAPDDGYTGPTVGIVPTIHRSATVGYHWALQ